METDPRAQQVTELLTVQAIARCVHQALAAKEKDAPLETTLTPRPT